MSVYLQSPLFTGSSEASAPVWRVGPEVLPKKGAFGVLAEPISKALELYKTKLIRIISFVQSPTEKMMLQAIVQTACNQPVSTYDGAIEIISTLGHELLVRFHHAQQDGFIQCIQRIKEGILIDIVKAQEEQTRRQSVGQAISMDVVTSRTRPLSTDEDSSETVSKADDSLMEVDDTSDLEPPQPKRNHAEYTQFVEHVPKTLLTGVTYDS